MPPPVHLRLPSLCHPVSPTPPPSPPAVDADPQGATVLQMSSTVAVEVLRLAPGAWVMRERSAAKAWAMREHGGKPSSIDELLPCRLLHAVLRPSSASAPRLP
jgi:hypothetical protein